MQVANIPLTSILGTPTYMGKRKQRMNNKDKSINVIAAPEIRACVGYGKAIDMWSLGVIVYILYALPSPFEIEC